MKVVFGVGIVFLLVLLLDMLDEIDFEWLGVDDSEVQMNYFLKGQMMMYNRGQFNFVLNNQGEFIIYIIDWMLQRI